MLALLEGHIPLAVLLVIDRCTVWTRVYDQVLFARFKALMAASTVVAHNGRVIRACDGRRHCPCRSDSSSVYMGGMVNGLRRVHEIMQYQRGVGGWFLGISLFTAKHGWKALKACRITGYDYFCFACTYYSTGTAQRAQSAIELQKRLFSFRRTVQVYHQNSTRFCQHTRYQLAPVEPRVHICRRIQ